MTYYSRIEQSFCAVTRTKSLPTIRITIFANKQTFRSGFTWVSDCYDGVMTREISRHYQDPLEIIWLNVARQCGIRVVRDSEVFASWDGQGVLRIGTTETLDPDDSLAQMILHELCHALVAGPDSFSEEDWGLVYDDQSHQVFEHAALRLQAALADEVGMREFFASTTDFRNYFDALPDDALSCDHEDRAAELATQAMQQLRSGEWYAPIRDGLNRTKAIADLIADANVEKSIWNL